jgi:hypothetical protein
MSEVADWLAAEISFVWIATRYHCIDVLWRDLDYGRSPKIAHLDRRRRIAARLADHCCTIRGLSCIQSGETVSVERLK